MDSPSYAKKLADYEKNMDPKKRQALKDKATKGMKFTHEEKLDEISMPKNTSYAKMSYNKLKSTHKDFKNMDSKPPRVAVLDKKTGGTVSKPVKFVPDKKPKSKMDEMITLTKGDYGSRNVIGSAYNTAAKKKFDPKIYKAGGGLGPNFLPLVNSHEPEGEEIKEKDTSAMKKYLDAKAKRLTKEKEAQKPEYKNNPAFGDPSHHSNRKNRKEGFSDWRSEFIWEDGDSVKKI